MFVLHFHVEEWRFASTKVHTWYCLKTRKFQSTQWGIGQIKADRKRWWKNTILSLSLQESTAWSICHWGEKDEEDDEIDRRYRPACNFSYFNAFQDPLWLDGMQDTFYTLFWFRPSPILKEKREFRCGLKAQVFFFFLVPQAIWLSEAEGPAVGSKIRIELAAPSIQFTPKSSRKQCSKAHVTHCILRQLISHNGWAMMRWKEGLGSNLTAPQH